jgi:YHS domain-containing protein
MSDMGGGGDYFFGNEPQTTGKYFFGSEERKNIFEVIS